MLAALITTLLWSASVTFGHRSAKILGGTEANFWRLAIATMLLAIWAHTIGQGLSGASFLLFFLSGVIGIGMGDVALFQALPRLGSRLSILLVQCLSAPFAALTEYLWLGTKLTLFQMICGGVILTGVSIALSPGKHLNLTRRQLTVGVIFGTIAALGNAIGAVLSRKGFAVAEAAGQDMDGATTAYQRLIGGLLFGGICLLVVKRNQFNIHKLLPPAEKWKIAWKWVLLNAIAGQTLGVSFYQLALKTAPTGIVLAITALTPLMVIPFASYFEKEKPQPKSIFGGVLAVFGVLGLIYSKYVFEK
ncbi:MAG: DMT family transporter [Verrucomicrobia bacterium]|nr:DMT family transporter [Verrucomicrobiota bacterium]